jgi:hypothetical protein
VLDVVVEAVVCVACGIEEDSLPQPVSNIAAEDDGSAVVDDLGAAGAAGLAAAGGSGVAQASLLPQASMLLKPPMLDVAGAAGLGGAGVGWERLKAL